MRHPAASRLYTRGKRERSHLSANAQICTFKSSLVEVQPRERQPAAEKNAIAAAQKPRKHGIRKRSVVPKEVYKTASRRAYLGLRAEGAERCTGGTRSPFANKGAGASPNQKKATAGGLTQPRPPSPRGPGARAAA